ncbi:helix-turn-helix transcriptional regulator [Heliobacterium chlorum]|uniref:Helix-turn-helix transcriptional regulator n=1 Tax=Heliobacterium chlorum TaxID=2698 RepID=A0ABR7T0C6_HELCL|nr:TetR/AcrR family transcriptional regulator [Heliobacterium chlorum]MBC9784244.1 helix-turn-helix transcriptional regulator [Heliobacterium chlorum]
MPTNEPIGQGRMERKKEETKKKIIAVALQLFKQQGFEATTMEQIAREVDIAKGTLYNYFPVKEAIIDEHIKRTFRVKNAERMLRLQELPDTRSRMTVIFHELMEGVLANKEFFEKYIVYRMRNMVSFKQDDSEKSGFYLVAQEIIHMGQKGGEIRDDVPTHVLVDLCEFAFVEVVKQCYLEPEGLSVQSSIEQCIDLFIQGAKA